MIVFFFDELVAHLLQVELRQTGDHAVEVDACDPLFGFINLDLHFLQEVGLVGGEGGDVDVSE